MGISATDATDTATDELIVQKSGEPAALRARYGEVTELSDGVNFWAFTRTVLEPETTWRDNLLAGITPLSDAPSQSGWVFKNFRRTTAIPFSPQSESVSVLAFLELSRPLYEHCTAHGARVCPHCRTPLLEVTRSKLEDIIFETLADKHVAIAIPTRKEKRSASSEAFPLVLVDGAIEDSSTKKLDIFDSILIDHCVVNQTNRKRLAEAIALTWRQRPSEVSLLVRKDSRFEEFRVFHIGDTCGNCHFIAPTVSLSFFRGLTKSASSTGKLTGSVLINGTSLTELLHEPLESLDIKKLPDSFSLTKKFAEQLLTPAISLSSPLSEISPPLRQRLHLLKHLIRRTVDSILVFEELFALAAADATALKEYLSLLAERKNSVLVISAPADKNAAIPDRQPSADALSLQQLAPGVCLTHCERDGLAIDRALTESEQREGKSPSVIAKLPSLTSLSVGLKTLAESSELIEPLIEFYQSLPAAIAHHIQGEQLLTALPASMTPRFKGATLPDALNLTVAKALEVFAHIPSCAKILRRLFDLNLSETLLNQPVALLSLGERQLVRLSHLNVNPAKRWRIYHIEHPFSGLGADDRACVIKLLGTLLEAGHALVLTTPEVIQLPFPATRVRLPLT